MISRKKLIEVALPLDAINKASAREKSIRHGHPSTLHLWWARRPLAAARAVIFSQMVDDPSAYVEVLRADPKLCRKAEAALKARLKVWEEARVLAKNTLAFLTADKARWQDLDEALRRVLAWDSILAEKGADGLNLDPHQVKQAEKQRAYSPSLANRLAGSTNKGIEALAEELLEAIKRGGGNASLPLSGGTEPVASDAVEEKWVDFEYPKDSGLLARLETEGYEVRWCADRNLSRRVDLEGWEVLREGIDGGRRVIFRLRDRPDNQTLIRRRRV
jgi:Protein of unknown function (DUF1156)